MGYIYFFRVVDNPAINLQKTIVSCFHELALLVNPCHIPNMPVDMMEPIHSLVNISVNTCLFYDV